MILPLAYPLAAAPAPNNSSSAPSGPLTPPLRPRRTRCIQVVFVAEPLRHFVAGIAEVSLGRVLSERRALQRIMKRLRSGRGSDDDRAEFNRWLRPRLRTCSAPLRLCASATLLPVFLLVSPSPFSVVRVPIRLHTAL